MSHHKTVGRPKKLNIDTTDMREYHKLYLADYQKTYKQHCNICDCDAKNMTAHNNTSKHKKMAGFTEYLNLFLKQVPEQQQLTLIKTFLNKVPDQTRQNFLISLVNEYEPERMNPKE
jgi:hypothetical protein